MGDVVVAGGKEVRASSDVIAIDGEAAEISPAIGEFGIDNIASVEDEIRIPDLNLFGDFVLSPCSFSAIGENRESNRAGRLEGSKGVNL